MPDYSPVSTTHLRYLERMWRRNPSPPRCERGHPKCGCTTMKSDGWAPCSEAVRMELARRKAAAAGSGPSGQEPSCA